MDGIVAVYADWGIGRDGTQPVTVSADRRRFRELTQGAAVIVGRKTLADFPGGRPLKNRHNIVLSRREPSIEGARVVRTPEEAAAVAREYEHCFVIGGASVYRAMFPYLDRIYVTRVDALPESDAFFPELFRMPDWRVTEQSPWQEENGVRYRFCVYDRQEDRR